jgi:hypothetical protein
MLAAIRPRLVSGEQLGCRPPPKASICQASLHSPGSRLFIQKMPAVTRCGHARSPGELRTLFGQVYDLGAALKMGVIGKTAALGRLLDEAVAWAALVPPNCAAARLDRDWLSRGMSEPASLRAHALRYRELKGREITWALPG